MCDPSVEMPGGARGTDGKEPPLLPPATEEDGREERLSVQQDGGTQAEHLREEASGAPCLEVGHEDEKMTSRSHDLSSSTNHSPGSTIGSTSTSTKRYLLECV